jgi:hypothetical protein
LKRVITPFEFFFKPESRAPEDSKETKSAICKDDTQLLQTILSEFLVAKSSSDTQDAVLDPEDFDSDFATVLAPLLKHMNDTCTISCTANGYLGSSASNIQEGDCVCVLSACPSPVVLRKK